MLSLNYYDASSYVAKEKIVSFEYINYKGVRSTRRVQPIEIRFGKTEWHNNPQWLLKAFDLDKNAVREFAIKDIVTWN